MAAIEIGPGSRNVLLDNVKITNFDVGVRVGAGAEVTGRGTTFGNVRVPWEFGENSRIKLRDNHVQNDPKLTLARGQSQVGFRVSKFPPFPARCPKCLTIFASQNYQTNLIFLDLKRNTETCPECGYSHAEVSEGLLRITSDIIDVLFGSDLTREMVAALRDANSQYINGNIDAETLADRYKRVSPELGLIAYRLAKKTLNGIGYMWLVTEIAIWILNAVYGDIDSRTIQSISRSNAYIERSIEDIRSGMNNSDRTLDAILKELQDAKVAGREPPHFPPPPPLMPEG